MICPMAPYEQTVKVRKDCGAGVGPAADQYSCLDVVFGGSLQRHAQPASEVIFRAGNRPGVAADPHLFDVPARRTGS